MLVSKERNIMNNDNPVFKKTPALSEISKFSGGAILR
jgi:hypothetical protein